MESKAGFTFKVATEEWEFEQIFALNYATFVEEVPQHAVNPSRRLIDPFHQENTYFICLQGNTLVGMVALRDRRPFSLDKKLGDIDDYLPRGNYVCEIRLLAVKKERRKGRVMQGLLSLLAKRCIEAGYDIAVISGNVTESKMYRGLGFIPFGPIVGTPDALFQPMYINIKSMAKSFKRRFHPSVRRMNKGTINLTPGPVAVTPSVKSAFAAPPISHRSPKFKNDIRRLKQRLCRLVNARGVEILLGSGTLANDAIAAQLSLNEGRGLVLANGEFGDRLLNHAASMGLDFDAFSQDWGRPFDQFALCETIENGAYSWLWAVHCETSTGMLNDIDLLKECCARTEVKLVLDCISSIGSVLLDLCGVYLASGVSGKGIGSYAGLSMVFYNHKLERRGDKIPNYLDIGLYAAKGGIPFTMSSNLMYALDTALDRFNSTRGFEEIREASTHIRERLKCNGFHIVAEDSSAAPSVITLALPPDVRSTNMGGFLEQAGYSLSYNSEYLLERNWIQICFMGDSYKYDLEPLPSLMANFIRNGDRQPAKI